MMNDRHEIAKNHYPKSRVTGKLNPATIFGGDVRHFAGNCCATRKTFPFWYIS